MGIPVAAGRVWFDVLDPAEDSTWKMIASAGTEKNKLLRVSGWLGNPTPGHPSSWLVTAL